MAEYDLSSLYVLLVDDYVPMRRILRGILKEWGVTRVDEAGSGAEAIAQLKDFPADIILADYRMSPMDGIEFTRKIRAGIDGIDPFVPIILISAYTEMRNIVEARDAGVTEFLAKPISARLVYYRIRSVIEHPRPFVRADAFFGPDRRRRAIPINGPDRRGDPELSIDQPQRQENRVG